MRSRVPALMMPLTLLGTSLLLAGCSVVGYGIGAAIDAHAPDSVAVQGRQLLRIEQGSPVKVTLTDGSMVKGAFQKGTPISIGFSDTLYMRARWSDSGCEILPALGDTAEFIQKFGRIRGEIRHATFRSYERGCDFCFEVAADDSSGSKESCLRNLLFVRRLDATSIPIGEITSALERSKTIVPFAGIEVATGQYSQQLPLDRIAQIKAPNRKHAKLTGLIIGAVLDILFLSADFTFSTSGWDFGD